jgi:hypothetical protein
MEGYLTCKEIHDLFRPAGAYWHEQVYSRMTWWDALVIKYECRIPYRWLRRRDKVRHFCRKLFRRIYGREFEDVFFRS